MNFTESFYARPVVLVTPKQSDNNNKANLSGSRCNAVTTWVEVRNFKVIPASFSWTVTSVYISRFLKLSLRRFNNMKEAGVNSLFVLFSVHLQLMHKFV